MSENKREYLAMGWTNFNHDAGNGLVVGASGHTATQIGENWLGTTVGNGKHQREGDQIYSKYIDYAFQFQTQTDSKYNTSIRFLIVKGTGNNPNNYSGTSIADWFVTDGTSSGSGNLLTQQVDKTKYTVLKDVIIKPDPGQYAGVAAAPTSAVAPNTISFNKIKFPVIRGRLKTGYTVQYVTGTVYPSKSSQRIQIAIIPYADSACGTATVAIEAAGDICHYFTDL